MTTRFMPGRGVVVVRARAVGPLGPQRLLLALDTGAAYTLLVPRAVEGLGYHVSPDAPTARLATVTEVVARPRVAVQEISALGVHRIDLDVVVSALPPRMGFDGLLGLDFLHNSRLTIDFRRGEIELAT